MDAIPTPPNRVNLVFASYLIETVVVIPGVNEILTSSFRERLWSFSQTIVAIIFSTVPLNSGFCGVKL